MAGRASSKHTWRYVQPSPDEMEEAIDELYEQLTKVTPS
jgi:hypothetical protein